MILSDKYMVSEISGNYAAIPVGQSVVDAGKMVSLNKTSSFICEYLKEEHTLDELLTALYEKYECTEADKKVVSRDTVNFLNAAKTIGLILE